MLNKLKKKTKILHKSKNNEELEEIFKLQQETTKRLKESLEKSKEENRKLTEENEVIKENNKTILAMCQFYIQENKFKRKTHKKQQIIVAQATKEERKETEEKENEVESEWVDVIKRGQKTHTKHPHKQKEDAKEASKRDNRIYCHFFNNKKICPFEAKCKFRHEASPPCRRNDLCLMKKCMFQHNFQSSSNELRENQMKKEAEESTDDESTDGKEEQEREASSTKAVVKINPIPTGVFVL